MYRASMMGGKVYVVKIESVIKVASEIEELSSSGCPVIIFEDLEDLHDFGVDKEDIKMAEW